MASYCIIERRGPSSIYDWAIEPPLLLNTAAVLRNTGTLQVVWCLNQEARWVPSISLVRAYWPFPAVSFLLMVSELSLYCAECMNVTEFDWDFVGLSPAPRQSPTTGMPEATGTLTIPWLGLSHNLYFTLLADCWIQGPCNLCPGTYWHCGKAGWSGIELI